MVYGCSMALCKTFSVVKTASAVGRGAGHPEPVARSSSADSARWRVAAMRLSGRFLVRSKERHVPEEQYLCRSIEEIPFLRARTMRISTKVHGLADYAVGLIVITLPFNFGSAESSRVAFAMLSPTRKHQCFLTPKVVTFSFRRRHARPTDQRPRAGFFRRRPSTRKVGTSRRARQGKPDEDDAAAGKEDAERRRSWPHRVIDRGNVA